MTTATLAMAWSRAYPGAVPGVWYFAYGSNMQTATLRGRRGVDFTRAVPAAVAGWRLVFDKPSLLRLPHAFANVVPEEGAEVLGVAFEVSMDDLAHIEMTEGVPMGNYRRLEVAVRPLGAVPDPPASAFTLASERRDPALRPSTRYLELVVAGALEHGLPAAWIASLRAVPAEPEDARAAALAPVLDGLMRRRPA
jgi:hypothetical protein